MSSISPLGDQTNLNADFFQRALDLRNQRQGGRVTIGDLAAQENEGSQVQQSSDSDNGSTSPSNETTSSESTRRTIETGRSEDARVEGNGFVGLEVGGEQRFARSVSLSVDDQGNVRDDLTGGRVQQQTTNDNGEVETETLQLSENRQTIEAEATSEAEFSGNISDVLAEGNSTTFDGEVTDSNGNSQAVTFEATRTAENQVELTAADPNTGENALRAAISFNDSGQVESAEVSENASGSQGLTVSTESGGSVNVSAHNLDFSGLSLSSGETTAGAATNGNDTGELQGLSLTEDGQIQGQFSNGQTRNFGRIATAQFDNSDELSPSVNGTFSSTRESGEANFSETAELSTGELETQGSDNTTQIVNDLLEDSGGNPGQRQEFLGSALDLFG